MVETGTPVHHSQNSPRVLRPHPLFPPFEKIRRMIIAEIVAPLPVIMIGGRTFYERKGVEERLATIDWGDIFNKFGLEGGYTLSMVISHERVRTITLHPVGEEPSSHPITQIRLRIDSSQESPSVSLEGVENSHESPIYGLLARNSFINWEITAQRFPRVFKQTLYEGIADILFVPSLSERSSQGWSPATFEAFYTWMADPQWVEAVKALPPARALKPGESFSWNVSLDERYKCIKGLSVLPASIKVSAHTVKASFTMERSETGELIIYPTAITNERGNTMTDKWPLVRALGNNSALDWKRTRDISGDLFDETAAVLMEHLVFERVLELERAKGGWKSGIQREFFMQKIKGAPWEKSLRDHPFFRNLPLQKPFVFVFHGSLERNFAAGLGIELSKNGSWLAYKKTKFQIGMRVTQKEPGKFEFDPPLAIGGNHHLVATTISDQLAEYRKALLSKRYSGPERAETFGHRFFPSLQYPTDALKAHQVAQTVLDTNEYRRLQWKAAPQFASPKETPFSLRMPRRNHQAKRPTAVHSVASVAPVNLAANTMLPDETLSLLEEV